MRLTNKLGLPQALVDAVRNDPYDNHDSWRTVTQLIAPPRVVILKKKHWEEIEEDIADRLFSLYGQIVHGILERANTTNLVENRLFMTVLDKKISGAYDTLQLKDGLLSDWKFSTVWKAGAIPHEWVAQMNLLAFLFRNNGIEIKQAEVILLMRDHSKMKVKRDPIYPSMPVMRMPTPLWSPSDQAAYMLQRVGAHLDAEKNLPECTDAERWAKEKIYAVMKKGRKSAVKLYNDKTFATEHLKLDPERLSIEERPGESIRCEGYCPAAKFCTQYQAMKGA